MADVALPTVRAQRRWSGLALRWRIALILALPIFIAFLAGSALLGGVLDGPQRSATTGFTTVTIVPQSLASALVDPAPRRIAAIGTLLLLAGSLAGFAVIRRIGLLEASAAETAQTAHRLGLAEARFAGLWNGSPDCLFVIVVTSDGRFVYEGLNPACERKTGLCSDRLVGKAPADCLPPKVAAELMDRYRTCVERGEPMMYDEALDLPGGRRHWQTSLTPVRDPETRRVCLLLGVTRDVTPDREARQQIERSQCLLQTTLDALSAQVAILDGEGRLIAVNQAWHRFAKARGFDTPEHGIGASYVETCRAAASADPQAGLIASGLEAMLARRRQDFRLRYRCGDRIFQMAAGFSSNGEAHIVVAHEDVTDLASARQDVRDIAGRLLSLQEDERQRIAADLHDSTAQHIVAAGLGLMAVQAVAGDPKRVERAVATVRTSLDEAQKEIRTLSYLLYPPSLRANGLAVAVRHFVAGFSERTGLAGTVRVIGDIDGVPVEMQQVVLRVVQEALVNVHRHAEASKVSVSLRRDARGLHLRVGDDGKGVPGRGPGGPAAPAKLGVGIPGMEARIRQFDGTMTIASDVRGTTIRATIPLSGGRDGLQDLKLGPERDQIRLS